MEIDYKVGIVPSVDEVIELYQNAGLPRPISDRERIHKMYINSNLIVSAWDKELLVGVSRSITDWCWSCYLADLAIRKDYQKHRIGKTLISITKEKVGDETMILLLSVPSAMEYYPKVGFEKENRGFMMPRIK